MLVPEPTHRCPSTPRPTCPPGYTADQRGVPGGFEAEIDIFDTWATSSLTPQLAGGWERDPELWNLVAPFDLRPQGQDIIRTWLFSTLLRSALEDDRAPWTDAAISGFIVDPDRKKMSKSKGNVVTPADILAQHGSDAVRYWAASSRLGTDAAFDPQNPTQIKIGRRLAIKVLNAAKFVLSFPVPEGAEVTHALDASMLATLDGVVREATKALDAYDHARALEVTESFFWTFCDDYLELVKERAYDRTDVGQASAALALRIALSTLLRLFAPVLVVRGRGVVVVVQRGLGAHRARGPSRSASRATPRCSSRRARPSSASVARRPRRRRRRRRPVARVTIAAPAETPSPRCGSPRATCKAVGRIAEITLRGCRRPLAVTDDRTRTARRPDMQLGTRWTSGDEPPAAVPDGAARADRARSMTAIPADQLGQPRPRWTLTWLEGRPIAELDTGVIVTLDADGEAVVAPRRRGRLRATGADVAASASTSGARPCVGADRAGGELAATSAATRMHARGDQDTAAAGRSARTHPPSSVAIGNSPHVNMRMMPEHASEEVRRARSAGAARPTARSRPRSRTRRAA